MADILYKIGFAFYIPYSVSTLPLPSTPLYDYRKCVAKLSVMFVQLFLL